MICKDCGSVIKNNEEYCRKCGALVITFKQNKNKRLQDLCIENNIRGKIRSFISRISNKDSKAHKLKDVNKYSFNKSDMGNLINKYNKAVGNSLSNSKFSNKKYNNNNSEALKETIEDVIQQLFKL